MAIWKPTHYRCPTLDSVPIDVQCGSDFIQVDYLHQNQIEDAFKVVMSASENGLNVGTDEYDRERFDDTLSKSEAFSLKRQGQSGLDGLVIIHPCFYCRSLISCLGYFEIFLTPDLLTRSAGIYQELSRLATRLTNEMGRYVGVVTSVFTLHADWVKGLLEHHFHIIATFPMDGNLPMTSDVDSYLLYMRFSSNLPKKLPTNEDSVVLAREMTLDIEVPSPTEGTEPLPRVPFLPLRYTVQQTGMKTIWRNATPLDGRRVFDLCMEDADDSNGYTRDEYPTFEYFYHSFFKRLRGIVVEEEASGSFVLYMGFGDFWPSRRLQPVCTDSMILAHRDFRGKGLTREINCLLANIAKELGYKGCISDAFLGNIPMHEVQRKAGFLRLGYMPYCGRLANNDYTEGVFSFLDIQGVPPFTELMKTNSSLSQVPPANL